MTTTDTNTPIEHEPTVGDLATRLATLEALIGTPADSAADEDLATVVATMDSAIGQIQERIRNVDNIPKTAADIDAILTRFQEQTVATVDAMVAKLVKAMELKAHRTAARCQAKIPEGTGLGDRVRCGDDVFLVVTWIDEANRVAELVLTTTTNVVPE